MERKNQSIVAYLTTPKCRSTSLDNNRRSLITSPSSPSTTTTTTTTGLVLDMMDPELPEAARLAHSKCFLMTESTDGKVLGCEEQVDVMPEKSRFVIRIYNRDFKNAGKLRDYVVLTIEDFNEIHGCKSEIEKKINVVRYRQTIIESGDLKVSIGPGFLSRPTVDIEKKGVRSSMYIETFTKMMNHSVAVNAEYSGFNARRTEDTKVIDEIINALAYLRNGGRPNGVIRQPQVRRCGIYTTCCKLVEQAKAILPRDK